jgi:hypothetical protein
MFFFCPRARRMGPEIIVFPARARLLRLILPLESSVARAPSLSRLGALKSKTRHIQPSDKSIDDPTHVIVRNQLFQGEWKEASLGPAFALHIAHKQDSLAFTRASSHLFLSGQRSFETEFRNSLEGAPFILCGSRIYENLSLRELIGQPKRLPSATDRPRASSRIIVSGARKQRESICSELRLNRC